MDIVIDGAITVSLSERNLLDLLNQAQNGTNVFLPAGGPVKAQLWRDCKQPSGEYARLFVQVEDNAAHYGDRTPGPGGLG